MRGFFPRCAEEESGAGANPTCSFRVLDMKILDSPKPFALNPNQSWRSGREGTLGWAVNALLW